MILSTRIVEDTIRRAQRAGFEPEKCAARISDRDRARFVTSEQKRARLAGLIAETDDLQDARKTLERQIGGNDLVSINYLARGLIAAQSICRIHLRNSNGDTAGFGSGFLVAPGVVMTNHHVISGPDDARHALAEFDYELDPHGHERQKVEFSLRTDPAPLALEGLDFCLVAVNDTAADEGRAIQDYGWIKLDPSPGKAFVGEYLTIIQHPGGERKQVCVRENKLLKFDESGNTVWYKTDTVAGSSGSPAFNATWQVVALHHSGVPRTDAAGNWLAVGGGRWDQSMGESKVWWVANEGIRVSRILQYLRAERADDPLARAVLNAGPSPVEIEGIRHSSASPQWNSRVENGVMRIMIPIDVAIGFQVGNQLRTPTRSDAPTLKRTPPAGNGQTARSNGAGMGMPLLALPIGSEKVVVDQTNYDERAGYSAKFLGNGKNLLVPLPIYAGKKSNVLGFRDNGKTTSVLKYWTYSVLMHRQRHLALFAAGNVDANQRPKGAGRDGDRWYFDTRIEEEEQIGPEFYKEQRTFEIDRSENPFDRGHLVRRLDAQWGENEETAKRNGDDSFHWTNCSPQHYLFNQGKQRWLGLEDYVIQKFAGGTSRACVINGPVFDAPLSHQDEDGRMIPNLEGRAHTDPTFGAIAIPKLFFKVVVTQRHHGLAAAAFLMSQEDFLRKVNRLKGMPESIEEALSPAEARLYQVSVSDIEKLTGLDFGPIAAADTNTKEFASYGPRILSSLADIRI